MPATPAQAQQASPDPSEALAKAQQPEQLRQVPASPAKAHQAAHEPSEASIKTQQPEKLSHMPATPAQAQQASDKRREASAESRSAPESPAADPSLGELASSDTSSTPDAESEAPSEAGAAAEMDQPCLRSPFTGLGQLHHSKRQAAMQMQQQAAAATTQNLDSEAAAEAIRDGPFGLSGQCHTGHEEGDSSDMASRSALETQGIGQPSASHERQPESNLSVDGLSSPSGSTHLVNISRSGHAQQEYSNPGSRRLPLASQASSIPPGAAAPTLQPSTPGAAASAASRGQQSAHHRPQAPAKQQHPGKSATPPADSRNWQHHDARSPSSAGSQQLSATSDAEERALIEPARLKAVKEATDDVAACLTTAPMTAQGGKAGKGPAAHGEEAARKAQEAADALLLELEVEQAAKKKSADKARARKARAKKGKKIKPTQSGENQIKYKMKRRHRTYSAVFEPLFRLASLAMLTRCLLRVARSKMPFTRFTETFQAPKPKLC